jgi:anti-sigma-K factor RskA
MPHSEISPAGPTANASHKGANAWWRALSIFLALLLAIGLAAGVSLFEQFKAQVQHMQAQLTTVPHIKYISVLLDAQQKPAMLITLDPQDQRLQLQRLNTVLEGQEDSMQLWAVDGGGKPRSLGVLTGKLPMQGLAVNDADLADAKALSISVEAKGGVAPEQGPRLPYLFSGAFIQKAQ